ncbi:YciI family protein [Leucobacter chromiiresistens]|uniref:Transcription initiation protein n=1 Tax=Leucobacter chromiiresistens TaxID=1079994 RepID=A0A147ERX3_9MICO|nr:YciI family protein [Leucobacter chromiiresistens]KTR87185.1 transcription initiation protein [Leucobacter chromiiresistens]
MSKYLISFPSEAMVVTAAELPQVVADSHAVVREAKRAGVWVFGGGIDESVAPVRVDASGAVRPGAYERSHPLTGGFTVIEAPTREVALEWAARFAAACRCPQEVRRFGDDPES